VNPSDETLQAQLVARVVNRCACRLRRQRIWGLVPSSLKASMSSSVNQRRSNRSVSSCVPITFVSMVPSATPYGARGSV
jgi:hypothetical protein